MLISPIMAQNPNSAFSRLAGLNLGAVASSWASAALGGSIGNTERKEDTRNAPETLKGEEKALHDLQAKAWDIARARAEADGRDRPNMIDYMVAARSDDIRSAAVAGGIQWTPSSMANFTGMELRDVEFRRDDFKPQTLTVADRESLGMTEDEISPFFAEVQNHITLDDTKLYNVHFHPADTFDDVVKGKVECHDVVFDGMDRSVNLTHGNFDGVKFINIQSGSIIVGDNDVNHATVIRNMDISSISAELSVRGNGMIDGLTVDDATRILKLDMAEGATIAHADFGKATISQAGSMVGSRWQTVNFNGTSLNGGNFSDAEFINVTFNDADLKGANLSGATFTGPVTIDGQTYTTYADIDRALKAEGAIIDPAKPIQIEAHAANAEIRTPEIAEAKIADPQFGRGADAARDMAITLGHSGNLANVIQQLQQAITTDIAPLPSLTAPRPDPAEAKTIKTEDITRISGGEHISHADGFSPGQALAEMEKPQHLIRDGGMDPSKRMPNQ